MIGEIYQDLRFCFRSLFRRPSAAIVAAVVAMAIGIGAAVAIFSVVKTVLLQPLPYPNADRAVTVWNQFIQLDLPQVQLSEPELYEYVERSQSLQALAAFVVGQGNLTGVDDPERVDYAAVSPQLFSILGVKASQGRVFVEGEDRPDAPRIIVLSDAFWRRRQGADPNAVGRDMYVNGNRYTIIGIMPPGFRFPEKIDLWLPLRLDPANPGMRGNHYLEALGQLKPGVTLSQAQAELDVIAQQLQKEFPMSYPADSGWGVNLIPLYEDMTGEVRPALLIFLAAVGLVL
ncbi:MAG TPA: ABC transporter permease, partial [Thermoanaerobaculia bacterium]|nr:ABC transporter permease [Thermoanaerobaculia bacterium]